MKPILFLVVLLTVWILLCRDIHKSSKQMKEERNNPEWDDNLYNSESEI